MQLYLIHSINKQIKETNKFKYFIPDIKKVHVDVNCSPQHSCPNLNPSPAEPGYVLFLQTV